MIFSEVKKGPTQCFDYMVDKAM